ncbi:MAG: ABC transporter ATP-binding protein [Calditerrivibrio sp.]|nr:ABC transporter ATP-binding protein [Calditerrivibrio sp.]
MLLIDNLNISINDHIILQDVAFEVKKGEILGIAGESGSGKTVLAKFLLDLLPSYFDIHFSDIKFCGISYKKSDLKELRGKHISMIFQNPSSSINPVLTIGDQLIETIKLYHKNIDFKKKAIEILKSVEIDKPDLRLNSYPHNLSGGMNQRVMIGMALASNPEILIADEPTTALDVTIQQEILNLLFKINKEKQLTILFISHDLKLLQSISDRVLILYAGEMMEILNGEDLLKDNIKHPYTYLLKKSVPSIKNDVEYLETIPGNIPKNSHIFRHKCIFSTRCPFVKEKCLNEKPSFKNNIKCHYPL